MISAIGYLVDFVTSRHLRLKQAQPKVLASWTPMKTKTKLALRSGKSTHIFLETYFKANIFKQTLNGCLSSTVRAFDLIPRLRAGPKYQLSSVTEFPYE